jgi:hypothetical protein
MKTFKTLLMVIVIITANSCKAEVKKELAILATPSVSSPAEKQFIRVALLLDTSNSMDGLIDQAKAQLWEIVNELSYATCKNENPLLEIALYEYGNDNLQAENGYVRRVLPFTNDLDEISKELFSLTTNGGSEYCGTVIQSSLEHLDWGSNADDLKLIFIAGNEPFTQGKINYREASLDAKEKGVIVNTIFCGEYQQGIATNWQEGAFLAKGDYMSIDHNQKTVYIASPYDDEILRLNNSLNKTYVYYGKQGNKKMELQKEQDLNAASHSKENAVSRTVTKGSRMYKNSSWDLVDAEESLEDFSYDELKEEELPEYLKNKSSKEIQQYVDKKRNERKDIQKEIEILNMKREEFIQSQQTEKNNTLENAMIEAIKKQAKAKDYNW